MSPEAYREELLSAAAKADWQEAERLSRTYGWSLLGQALLRALVWMRDALRIAAARRGPSA
jgi:hypothetical protein